MIMKSKSLIKKIDEFSDKVNLSKKYPGYFNKNIFRAVIIICLALFIITLFQNKFSNFYAYAECKDKEPCKNPYYVCQEQTETDCVIEILSPNKIKPMLEKYGNIKELEPGQIIGNKPNFLAMNFNLICLTITFLAFSLNHYLYKTKQVKQ